MDRAAVLGRPVKKSLSPKIFAAMAHAEKHEIDYRRIDLRPSNLRAFLKSQKNFVGFNVTIPHKEKVLKLADRLSPEVRAIGAANVLHFTTKGSTAYNTDVFGIRQTLREQGLSLRGKQAVLYGAGGAARAVAYALTQEGAKTVWIYNRTYARAKKLSRHFNSGRTRFLSVRKIDQIGGSIALLVNATPAGEAFDLPPGIHPKTLAFDLVYRPRRTAFLRKASKLKLSTVNGLDMLLWQAIATWELWFGKVRNRRQLKEKLCHCVT